MNILCTLFENHYKMGGIALINSLYANGFNGIICIGYKGLKPILTDNKNKLFDDILGNGFILNESLKVYLFEIKTDIHLAHYKAKFLIQIASHFKKDFTNIYYFDPDIVIKCRWSFFEEWVNYGVAIVHEVISNDMPDNHPIRQKWKQIIINANKSPKNKISSYLNSGFLGVSYMNLEFIYLWDFFIELAISKYKQNHTIFINGDRTYPFWNIDQDTFNMTTMSCDQPLSEIGPEGMDFYHGGQIMSHAVGTPKPWNKYFFIEFIKGNAPSFSDKEFWRYSNGIIKPYSMFHIKYKQIQIKVFAFLSRFYKK